MVLCFAALLSACAQESSTPASPGCLMNAAGTCASAATMTEATCTAQLGTWSAGGCPGEGLVGTCATAGALVAYYGPLWTAASGQYACAGIWTPVPAPPPPPAPTGTITVSCTAAALVCIDATGVFTDAAYADFRSSCSGTVAQVPCALADAVPGYCEITTTQPGYAGLAIREYLSAAYYTPSTAASTCASLSDATMTATWRP
jgi:hypothetical protein